MANVVKGEDQPIVTRPIATEVDDDNQALQNVEVFYERNKKPITIAVVAVVALVAGFFGYRYYNTSRDGKAAAKAFYAQQYFMADSAQLALKGDGQHYGFLKVIKEFGGTKTANLAHYYAGVSYMKLGDTKNAIKYLEDFDGKGTMVGTAAHGLLGNAYMETGKTDKAIDEYKKATENDKDIVQTPMYLFTLGAAYEIAKKPEDAKKAYLRIRDEYPTSMQARDIDRYLAKLGEIE
jgi:predicted negative regulator of RcsB-dependent stress response